MAFNFFTAFHRALQDPEAYYSFQKEMNSKAVEQVFFNFYAGRTTFEAVVLPPQLGKLNFTPDQRVLRVRPLGIQDFIIPEPCVFEGFPKKIKKVIDIHPLAFPEDNAPENPTNQTADVEFHTGEIVLCRLIDGSSFTLNYRRSPKSATGLTAGFSCLTNTGGTSAGEAQKAFAGGGYVPNLDLIPKEHLDPPNIVDQSYILDPRYSIPSSGPTMSPKNIVIHYGASSNVIGDQKWGAAKKTPAGYHFGVRRNGTVVQFMEPTRRIVHATSGYFNNNAISINFENVGYERKDAAAQDDWIAGTNIHSLRKGKWQPYTDQQYDAGSKLIAWLCKTFKMNPVGNSPNGQPTIVGHDYVTVVVEKLHIRKPKKVKSDPGPAFDMDKIRKLAQSKIGNI